MRSISLLLATFLITTPAYGQFVFLEDIDVAQGHTDSQVLITLNGKKPASCFQIDSSSQVEDNMVTVQLEVKFPSGTTRCTRGVTPFKVVSDVSELPPGDYEVQVTINGEMQVNYRIFNVAESGVSAV